MRRLVSSFALASLLALPAAAQVEIGKDGSVTVKDGKDSVKVGNDGVAVGSGDKTSSVTGSGVVLDKGGAHDCAVNADPVLNGAKVSYALTGACKSVTVNGNENTVTVEKVASLTVNGNKNKVHAKELEGGVVNGANNEVLWQGTGKPDLAAPAVKVNGKKNSVKKTDAAAAAAAADASKKTSDDVNAKAKKEEKKAEKEVKGALGNLGIK